MVSGLKYNVSGTVNQPNNVVATALLIDHTLKSGKLGCARLSCFDRNVNFCGGCEGVDIFDDRCIHNCICVFLLFTAVVSNFFYYCRHNYYNSLERISLIIFYTNSSLPSASCFSRTQAINNGQFISSHCITLLSSSYISEYLPLIKSSSDQKLSVAPAY